MGANSRVIYCHCAHARIIPDDVKADVLDSLCESELDWQAVSDLCEMTARRDPALNSLCDGAESVKIAACYPRAIKWLFGAANVPYNPEKTQVCNMRLDSAEDIVHQLRGYQLQPNIPTGPGKAPAELTQQSETA